MAYFQYQNVNFHYQEIGSGEAMIALHGLSQNTGYWMGTGVAAALVENYRVIALDMRAHGLTTIAGTDKGYDIDTMVNDIDALADHLGLDRFHLLGHSTGGMIAARYAMTKAIENKHPLISLMLTNCSSATNFINKGPEIDAQVIELLAQSFENQAWEQMIEGLKVNSGPLFAGIAAAKDSEQQFNLALELMQAGNGKSIAEFIRNFYNDADPKVDELRKIDCPTLVAIGELDSLFIDPSDLMAHEIPNAKQVICENVGHMTAIESPQWLINEVKCFLNEAAIQ